MPQNRRQHQRMEFVHPARMIVGGRPVAQCQIRNYSEGGLFLQMEADALKQVQIGAADLEQSAQHAYVQLVARDTGQPLPFEIPVRIASAVDAGFGVAFMNPSQEVLDYLSDQHQQYSQRAQEPTPRVLSAEMQALLQEFRGSLRHHLQTKFHTCLMLTSDTLLETAEHASLQSAPNFTFASRKLVNEEVALQNRLLQKVEASWEQLVDPLAATQFHRSADTQQLELVDQDEFDEWAGLMSVARRSEGRVSNILHTLSQCLAYMVRLPISNDTNPMSPYSLLWSYRKALVPLELQADAREVAYRVFGEQILSHLQSFYNSVYARMEAAGVSAEVAERFALPKAEDTESTPTNAEGGRRHRSLVDTLASMFGRSKEDKQGVNPDAHPASNAAVANALDDMVQGDTRGLADRIEQALGGYAGEGGEVVLPQQTRQVIDATEQLISAAQQDPRHSSTMRQLLRQIQLPLAKAAIENPDVLNDAEAPSRKLLDDIDQLALLLPAHGASTLVQQTNAELQAILAALQAAGGRADLTHVSLQISDLLDRRKNDFLGNVEQVQAGCSREFQHHQQVLEVRKFLQQELGQDIAEIVDRLLRYGWAGLLVETAVRGDLFAKHLKTYKSALVLINKAFQASHKSAKLDEKKLRNLVQVLESGFRSYPLYREQGELLISELQQAVSGDGELFGSLNGARVDVDEGYLDQLLPDSVEAANDAEITDEWAQKTSQLQVGDWITEQLHQGQVRLLNLAWVDPSYCRFVFVDGSGNKALDSDLRDFSEGLRFGRYSTIEEGGLPMVDRAVDRVLRNTFDRLRQESDLDNITSLPNRRAYERELMRLMQVARSESCMHILMCIDIDNFSLVNDLYGIEGGDRLLQKVGTICKSFMMKPGLLARTGDNEYSILIEYCGIDEGYRIAESVRKAIENFHFEWGGRSVSVTVSIGLTEITADDIHSDEITQAAVTACHQAKKEGHNQCRRYQQKGIEFTQHKKLAESVPVIEKAIEQNQLELHAQLISPIFIGDGHPEHHEILLRKLDEKGDPESPFELIQAAEQYDRMRSVDRWVVGRFFKWINDAASSIELSTLGHFSINLSGQSVTDAAFVEFLLNQIRASKLAPSQLAFEITETAMVTQIDKARGLVETLKEMGCSFFLDDFGSGYASYSYLKELPVDVVKIDGIFVKDLSRDDASYAMVKSITEVAHHLDKLVIAEYVEDESILNALRQLEVDFAQGFCLGKPAPLANLLVKHPF